jgi:hypothetical protein
MMPANWARSKLDFGVHPMMHDMMGGAGIWTMGIVGALAVVVLLLSLAALIKYLFFR